MILVGADFRWENSEYNFYNIDHLMEYINNNPIYNKTYNIRYSTASDYIRVVHKNQRERSLYTVQKNEKNDMDLYPYSDE